MVERDELSAAWVDVSEALSTTHSSASRFVTAFLGLLERGTWRAYRHPLHGERRWRSFRAFVEGEARMTPEAAIALARSEGNSKGADAIARALREDVAPLGPVGRPAGNGGVTTNREPNTAEDVLARLKRDDPALAAEVVAGDLTPHAAAVRAGIRARRATFPVDRGPEPIAASLRKHVDVGTLRSVLALLAEDVARHSDR